MALRLSSSSDGGGDNPLEDASWLYSYADLVTQMLLFVILMVTGVGLYDYDPDKPGGKDAMDTSVAIDAAHQELLAYIKDKGLDHAMQIDKSADRLVLRLKSVLLFQPGEDALTPRARQVLRDVAGSFQGRDFSLRVEGHTDDRPINTARFPSNWELSTARAISVVQFFERVRVPREKLSAAGYGEYHPIVDNGSAENRAMNRRVELVILGGAT